MKIIKKGHIPPKSGTAFILKKGQLLKVIDPKGEQVADLMCFNEKNKNEYLSSGRSIDYNNKIYFKEGDILYSSESKPMLTITEDKVNVHDFLLTPCCSDTFKIIYNKEGLTGCYENLCNSFKDFGIERYRIPTTFNVFMSVKASPDGTLTISAPPSKAGDYTIFRAEMDLITGLTACSAEITNNYKLKPIDYEILSP